MRVHGKSEHRIERIKDAAVLRLRNKLLPLVQSQDSLLKLVPAATSAPERGFIVVTQVGAQTFGLVVDVVFHTEEIVVKPMSTKLRHIGMFSGNTILGDGSVIMIVDPNGVRRRSARRPPRPWRRRPKPRPKRARSRPTTPRRCWCSAPARREPKAVPLSLVTRLEEIDCRKIELSNNRTWCSTAVI